MDRWSKFKIFFFLTVSVASLIGTPEVIEDTPPLFVYPFIAMGVFIFGLGFFKGSSLYTKLTVGRLPSPLKISFQDPLPIYHFISISAVASGICGSIKGLIRRTEVDPIFLFELAAGLGLYASVMIANQYFIKEPEKLKKV